ncbi:Arv1-like family-domain-containing protein [Hysterangium stoloniferum]|nr:Arv1-like family-domain-containing protein [Hysterangium stoloniferum]
MPICTTCTAPVQHLYTVYQSENNLRLEQCSKCLSFADQYVEYDTLTLLLDLILLKRGVYRHLLFNRGSPPKREVAVTNDNGKSQEESVKENQDHKRWKTVVLLAATLILADAFIRWSERYSLAKINDEDTPIPSWNQEAGRHFILTLLGCFIAETISFHIGVIFFSVVANRVLNGLTQNPPSSIRGEFRTSRISLSLLYSSLTKLFLLLTLSIWPAGTVPTDDRVLLPSRTYGNPLLNSALELLDEDKLNRHWIVRNVLGGMAAGFGLRVALDCHPSITACIIMGGWWFKTWVSGLTSKWWVGEGFEQAWLAYSIP